MRAALFASLVIGSLLVAFGDRLGRRAFLVGALAPALSLALVAADLAPVLDGTAVVERWEWIPGLGLDLGLRLDGLAAGMSLLVAGVGVLVLIYAAGYFSDRTEHPGRIAGLLVLFAGAMTGVVQADHLVALYVFWELTTVTSYLLIGNQHDDPNARAAALHALLVTVFGGLAMLAGFVVLGHAAGTYRLSELVTAGVPTTGAVTVAMVLILLGALTKSAQYPFHAWLPGAMAAPTPVSAYLHSATMVKAGVYLVARLAPVLVVVAGWRLLVVTIGLVTLVLAGLRALRQFDLKLLLAHSTVSQLGLMMVLFGTGLAGGSLAGWLLLVAHALYKALLFMVVGTLDHQTGTRDYRYLPPLHGPGWRWLELASAVGVLSMAGVPLIAGFIAKEAATAALLEADFTGSGLALAAVVAGSMLTVAYAIRFHIGAFWHARRRSRVATTEVAEPGWRLVGPATVFALASLILGVVPSLADRFTTAVVRGLVPSADEVHLALWHGFNLPLALTALVLIGGVVIARARHRTGALLATGAAVPSGELVYLSGLRAIARLAQRVTAVVQSGSLPVYSGVILMAAALLPGLALVLGWDRPGPPALGGWADLAVALLLVMTALGAAVVRRRFSAAIILGAAGYAMAGLFVLMGAPDLALTQAVVETLATVVFVLVLRRLPDEFERQSTIGRRVVRGVASVLVGLSVFVFALAAADITPDDPVSEEMVARSVPDAHGANVVNVILVDFRALDTMGEISVLAVASIGAVALARAGRRGPRRHENEPPARVPLQQLTFVDVSVRVIFHVVVMMSLWLLFAGHNQPGGGFVGGLLAGAALTLRYVAGGLQALRERSRFRPWTVLGAGLLLSAATAIAPLLLGGAILEVGYTQLDLPAFGKVSLSSALVFDTGVYLAVVGVVLMAFEAFGDERSPEVTA